MKSETPLDYAVFQLSPKRSRCELLVSSGGNTEKLASGSVKPFATHLKVAEEQVALAVQSIKLEIEKSRNAETWFTKGTLERFVRFVSTPEVLELVNTFDAEMSQLEAARKIYSQGMGEQSPGALVGDGAGVTAAADATKKKLLRAIDVRLSAASQDLTTAYARATAAGFNPDTISDLQVFADRFGAHRLNEACTKFTSLCQRRPDLINQWKPRVDDGAVRSSYGSDMSIDDPTDDSSGPHHRPQNKREQLPYQSGPSTCQQPTAFPTLGNVNGKNDVKEETPNEASAKEGPQAGSSPSSSSSSTPAGPPARRLSVQDRINLFESKQKEQSSAGSGGKPVVGKSVELRRLSSDVPSSAAVGLEKAALRRWNGMSDMSIDLSAEKKDTESPLCTPSSVSSVSHVKSNNVIVGGSEGKYQKGLNDSNFSSKAETRTGSSWVGDDSLKDQAEGKAQVVISSGKDGDLSSKLRDSWKEQAASQTQFKYSTSRAAEQVSDQKVPQEEKNSLISEDKKGGFKDQASSATQSRGFSERLEIAGAKFQATKTGSFAIKTGDVSVDGGFANKVEDFEQVDQPVTQSRSRSFQSHSRSSSGQFNFGGGVKLKEASSAQPKQAEGDQLPPCPQWRSFTGGLDGGEVDLASSGKQQVKAEDSGVQKMKFRKPVFSSREQMKSQVRRDESNGATEDGKFDFSVKMVSANQVSLTTMSKPPVEQVQRTRQTKGNQELNDELKMKANELEKLFAEHKLRVPGDQPSLAWRSKPADMQIEEGASSQNKKSAPQEIAPSQLREKSIVMEPSHAKDFVTPLPKKMAGNQDSGDALRQNFSELGFSDDSRGKFYERYMQKRDDKLREEWGSKRAEKEAKLKAMQDTLERSRAELKAKFSGSADRQDSASNACLRAEKLISLNLRSSIKRQQSIDSIASEEEDLSEFPGQKLYGQDRFLGEASSGDGTSRPTQNRKPLPNRNLSSSTPRTTGAPAPRSSAKLLNSNSGKRRTQLENPVTHSVPNFSDFRKENTKPTSGVSKAATRSQVRSYARSRSASEETPNIKEEKPRRSHSRKNSANHAEFMDLSTVKSEGVILAPLKYDKGQTEPSLYEKFPKNIETKSFLRKGNGIGPFSGASIAKLKASVVLDLQNEEFDELGFEEDDFVDMAKAEEEEELETMAVEDCNNMDNGKSRLSNESDKSRNSGSENGDSARSLYQVDPAVSELHVAMPSALHAAGALQDSPGESPVSWNSRIHHLFSYPHEASDIDASVDSPIGSPSSWNSHGLTQTEADAARMRKKWGSAQKPFLASNSSHNQSRKDTTKGFKRLLKFGRKNRGTESLVDWISATTSEGDDDTEDGRDLANRSSEDLRKSRMGFFQGPSDDSINESESKEHVQSLQSSIPAPPVNFGLRDDHMSGSSLKAPRSFFSLSTFRSKGGDSKAQIITIRK